MLNRFTPARKTVACVMTAFSRALDDLKEVERTNEADATRHAQTIAEAQAAHDAAIAEAATAREVAKKIGDLVSPVIADFTLEELKKECV